LARPFDPPLATRLAFTLILVRLFKRALIRTALDDARKPNPAVHPAPSAELGEASTDAVDVDASAVSDRSIIVARFGCSGRAATNGR
jgi:hypothetical protein